jgi:hypothetical protein
MKGKPGVASFKPALWGFEKVKPHPLKGSFARVLTEEILITVSQRSAAPYPART